MNPKRPLVAWGTALFVVVMVLAALRPWTIRPIETAPPKAFDSATFATSAWPRVLAEADRAAVDVTTSDAPADGLKARFVKGTGVVTAVDRQSRVGVIRVNVAGSGGSARVVAVQVPI